jgi:serine/threonine protein kinase
VCSSDLELAETLVNKKKLTKYQAERIFHGKGRALVLGNYTILDKIGAGGMGQVFKAEHRRMHRIVAVKVLARSRMKDASSAARFEREVTVAAKLNHPNIVTAFDADYVNGFHLFVMEYVDGSDLWATVKKTGPLPIEQAVECILQAARGLEAAHAAGILHRDVKPSNLILDKKGTVKVVDLGLAYLNVEAESDQQASLTEDGTVLGTADFMSPEQALDSRTADARSDIYGLGCTLYYLLTGQLIYPAETRMQKALAHREQPIPSLRALGPEATEQVETVFRKMVAKRVEDRHQSMTEVIGDLEGLQKGGTGAVKSQQAAPESMPVGMSKFLKEISTSTDRPVVPKKSTPWLVKNWKRMPIRGSLVGGLILVAGVATILWTRNDGRDVTMQTSRTTPLFEGSQSTNAKRSHDTTPQPGPAFAGEEPVVAENRPLAETLSDVEFEKWLEHVASLPAE